MSKFKVGDRVRRQAQWRDYAGWSLEDQAVVVTAVNYSRVGGVKVADDPRVWEMDRFDLVERAEPEPYAIQVTDFDPAKHERQDFRYDSLDWSSTQIDLGYVHKVDPERWIVVRDRVEPLSLREFIETLDHTQYSAWDMAERLKGHGYATQYPSKAEEA